MIYIYVRRWTGQHNICIMKTDHAQINKYIKSSFACSDWQNSCGGGGGIDASWQLYCQLQLKCRQLLSSVSLTGCAPLCTARWAELEAGAFRTVAQATRVVLQSNTVETVDQIVTPSETPAFSLLLLHRNASQKRGWKASNKLQLCLPRHLF
jgi:hypothetical protein